MMLTYKKKTMSQVGVKKVGVPIFFYVSNYLAFTFFRFGKKGFWVQFYLFLKFSLWSVTANLLRIHGKLY